jgi:hypothetical protein
VPQGPQPRQGHRQAQAEPAQGVARVMQCGRLHGGGGWLTGAERNRPSHDSCCCLMARAHARQPFQPLLLLAAVFPTGGVACVCSAPDSSSSSIARRPAGAVAVPAPHAPKA